MDNHTGAGFKPLLMRFDYIRLTGLALLFFVPFLGAVHLFDWNEINLAESSREMLLTGDFLRPQLNFEPFWGNPPLFFWIQALSMKIFGVGEFAARFPNAIAGLITLLLTYRLGRRLHDRSFGWLWAFAWLGSLLPHLYFRTGMIDPWFNLLVFASLYGFIEFRWQFFSMQQHEGFWRRYRYLLAGGWMLGLAMLMNGPAAYLIISLTLLLYWARYRFRNKGFFKHLVMFSLAALSVPLLWLGVEMGLHGAGFAREFLAYQFSTYMATGIGLGGFPGYQVLVLLLGCFPVSVFALPNLWGDRQSEDELLESDTLASCKRSDLATWMQLLFWVVLVLFIFFPTEFIHVTSITYFPLTYLGALTLWRAMRWNLRPKIVAILLPALGVLIGLAEFALPLQGNNWLQLWQGDPIATQLHQDISWSWWQSLPGLILVGTSVAGWYYWQKKQVWKSAQTVFTGGAVFMAFTLLGCAPCVEQYTQHTVIEFYESKAGENCYIKPVGFTSNAHLFYTRMKPEKRTGCRIDDYPTLSRGNPGKKVYFVAKSNNLRDLPQLPGCRELYRKNGYVFFERSGE